MLLRGDYPKHEVVETLGDVVDWPVHILVHASPFSASCRFYYFLLLPIYFVFVSFYPFPRPCWQRPDPFPDE